MPYDRTIPRTCEQCNSPFLANTQKVKQGRGRFCSAECHYANERAKWVDRFWANVQKTDGCWLWIAGKNASGYGKIKVNGRHRRAHQVSWELHNGLAVPPGVFVCHNCPGGDNPSCVNPAHLFLGTVQENNDDKVTKSRQNRGTAHARAKLTEESVRAIRDRHASGDVALKQLAREYGVSDTMIGMIVQRRSWKHVA